MEIKYLEWNLHAKGGIGYLIPKFICEHIKDVDIFVLVEFCNKNDWEEFEKNLCEFDLYCSPNVPLGYNQVCIGIRKNIGNVGYKLLSVHYNDVYDVTLPEFLQVEIEVKNKKLSIIGTRIKTQSKTLPQQFHYLKQKLNTLSVFCCLGDFNAQKRYVDTTFSTIAEVYGPRIVNGYHSFVHKDGTTCGLDWLISKGLSAVYNGYNDAQKSPYATYDWSFVNSNNGYDKKTKYDYLNINGLPDHAILKGMFRL